MRLSLALALAIAFAPQLAFADTAAGLVVTGDATLQAPVTKRLRRWLVRHDFKVVASPLARDAIDETATCLTAGDPHCARAVVESHATTERVLYVRIEVAAKTKDITLDAYWFVRDHETVVERRMCEHCEGNAWGAVADRMLGALVAGDTTAAGADAPDTPDTPDVDVKPASPPPPHADRPSRLVSLLLIGVGVAALAGGIGLIYEGEQNGKDVKYIYPFDTPEGIALATAGVGVMAGGVVLLVQSRSSTPVAAISPHGAYLGWQARF